MIVSWYDQHCHALKLDLTIWLRSSTGSTRQPLFAILAERIFLFSCIFGDRERLGEVGQGPAEAEPECPRKSSSQFWKTPPARRWSTLRFVWGQGFQLLHRLQRHGLVRCKAAEAVVPESGDVSIRNSSITEKVSPNLCWQSTYDVTGWFISIFEHGTVFHHIILTNGKDHWYPDLCSGFPVRSWWWCKCSTGGWRNFHLNNLSKKNFKAKFSQLTQLVGFELIL